MDSKKPSSRPGVRAAIAAAALFLSTAAVAEDAPRNLYWGDTHLHSNYSFDAYLFQNYTGDPDLAYRFAKGVPVLHPKLQTQIQIETPLDFLVLADHAELTAVPLRIFEKDEQLLKTAFGKRVRPLIEADKGGDVFAEIVRLANAGMDNNSELTELQSDDIRRPAWEDIVEVADRHNEPGKFTAFIGWEWSSLPDAANLHRVVFMDKDAETGKKFLPYGSTTSVKPEDLWAWLEETEELTGANFVAIPHNMNISKGRMFETMDSDGRPITDAYARTRMRWEPVAEVTQYKGDSETHPILSPDDEFANFETYRHLIDTRPDTDHTASVTNGDYARGALKTGLKLESDIGVNPFKFGMIGATDSHTSLASAEETNFFYKFPFMATPTDRSEGTPGRGDGPIGWNFGAQGLAGVWAEENTRESILTAFKRKEVFATTGPRIMLRFFGGWNFRSRDARANDVGQTGYDKGVSMGADLMAPAGGLFSGDKTPSFLIQAVSDPKSGNLDRIQIVKGWLDAEGQTQEKVFNVVASDGRTIDSDGKLAPVGNTVDLATATYTNTIGDPELVAVWRDPEFDPTQRAFYYVRVLEIPTPRHALLDALSLQTDLPEGVSAILQERAYSSPIWYTPPS